MFTIKKKEQGREGKEGGKPKEKGERRKNRVQLY